MFCFQSNSVTSWNRGTELHFQILVWLFYVNKRFLWAYLKEKQSMVTKIILIWTHHILVTLYELICDCFLILKSTIIAFQRHWCFGHKTIVVNVAGLRLLGIGRNQYIDLMNQCRSSKVSINNTPALYIDSALFAKNHFLTDTCTDIYACDSYDQTLLTLDHVHIWWS